MNNILTEIVRERYEHHLNNSDAPNSPDEFIENLTMWEFLDHPSFHEEVEKRDLFSDEDYKKFCTIIWRAFKPLMEDILSDVASDYADKRDLLDDPDGYYGVPKH